ncbi:uncharacterized protein LOC102674513 [Apis dorsata]|uniref:uncharacterized protein LOC102674513 n=1 Tax=Apis dorsata TaxID=7462 RepID=UPI0003DF7B87|nr:uncharacterized protein LOC102674513 [Apis dorsata]
MVIRSAVQSASNMLQRTFLVVVPLTLCALLAACRCTLLHRSDRDTVPIDCSRGENSIECVTRRRMEGMEEGKKDRSVTRESRIFGGEEVKSEDGAIEQVAGRRKKNKGYGQMLLYLLGASKMTMLYVITNVVAAIAGKALIVAKVALAIATAIALKRILEHKEKISYEIIKYPYHSYENTHSTSFDYDHGGSWERNFGYQRQKVKNRKLVR